MERDWANLEALPLSLVLDKLEEPIDHVWFGAVCKNWRSQLWVGVVCKNWQSIAKLKHQSQQFRTHHVLPMLMIPTKGKSSTETSLYIPSLGEGLYPIQLPVIPYNKRYYCGTNHGWVATIDDANNVITLLNPFKNVVPISLPPLNHECNIRKVTLSADPIKSPNDYVVVAIYSKRCCLAFIRAGQIFWTYINTDDAHFIDVVFYNGLVYAVTRRDDIRSFSYHCYSDDPSGNEKITPEVVLPGGGFFETSSQRAYLVKSLEGDLWMVRRLLAFRSKGHSKGTTEGFQVYRLELDGQIGKLRPMLKLESLGDNVLFLGGFSNSISMSYSCFSSWLQKDSIYYADDFDDYYSRVPFAYGEFDLGIYNVKDGSFGHYFPYNPSFEWMLPPFWVLQPFQWE